MRALLDVNALIALHDRDPIHHTRAAQWLEANIQAGWASCPLTQIGCLRITSQPGYNQPQPQPLPALMAMLHQSTSTAFHARRHQPAGCEAIPARAHAQPAPAD